MIKFLKSEANTEIPGNHFAFRQQRSIDEQFSILVGWNLFEGITGSRPNFISNIK